MAMKLNLNYAGGYACDEKLGAMQAEISKAHAMLHEGTGQGSDFLGWIDLPVNYDKEEFARIKKAAEKIRSNSDVLVVIGIGGSYLGAKAAIDFLNGPFYNDTAKTKIVYAGNSISPNYLNSLIESIDGLDVSVNIIFIRFNLFFMLYSKSLLLIYNK